MKLTFLFEFLSRGASWLRLIIISALVSPEDYSLVILVVSAEALFGSVIAYPHIRETLYGQQGGLTQLWNAVILFLVLSPIVFGFSYWYFADVGVAVVVLVSTLFFALYQISMYVLRIGKLSSYNRTKLISSVLATAIFLFFVPKGMIFLPIVSFSAFLVSIYVILKAIPPHEWWPKKLDGIYKSWLVYGVQSLSVNAWQYGNRFLVGFIFTAAQTAIFLKTYLIASGITFYLAAMMVVYEKHLSKKLADGELGKRLSSAGKILFLIIGGVALYYISVVAFLQLGGKDIEIIRDLLESVDVSLLCVFAGLFVVRAIQLVLNPIVIASGRRVISLQASIVAMFVQFSLFLLFWEMLTLNWIAFIMVISQVLLVAYLWFKGIGKIGQA
ncbi:hypothetical protein [Halopseudomonas bauzanensis]|uniref:hypothetical protein n=1 Tax=Halopseudomonas bauzanensis TaxID=653930 RepID=UPI002553EEBE|nr:hypothetical protein [Halopseudomonas bauzanensis]